MVELTRDGDEVSLSLSEDDTLAIEFDIRIDTYIPTPHVEAIEAALAEELGWAVERLYIDTIDVYKEDGQPRGERPYCETAISGAYYVI